MWVELIKSPTELDWALVKACALVTVGRYAKEPPSSEWKKKILRARHSPIRELHFVFALHDVPYWVSVHLVRHHVGCQPYVRSQRNDRQSEYDRTKAPQDAPVEMIWSMNADALMTIAAKRLCGKTSPETRAVVEMMCNAAVRACPELDGLLVPQCEWNGGRCDEMLSCGRCDDGT